MDRVNGPSALGALIFLTGPMAGKTYQIGKPVITIGRDNSNDVVVSDPAVSRHHAELRWESGSWTIINQQPKNILKVNDHDIQQGMVQDRDRITLGAATTFVLQAVNVTSRAVDPQARTFSESAPAAKPTPSPFTPAPPFESSVPQLSFDAPPATPVAGPSFVAERNAPSFETVDEYIPQISNEQAGESVQAERFPAPPPASPSFAAPQAERAGQYEPLVHQRANGQQLQDGQQGYQVQQEVQPPAPKQPFSYQQAQTPPREQRPLPPTQKADFGQPVQQRGYIPAKPQEIAATGIQNVVVPANGRQEQIPQQFGPGGTVSRGVPSLEVTTNTDRDKQVYPLNKPVMNIGRAPAPTNDIVIDRPTVSGQHAQLVREGNQLAFVHPHPARAETLNGIIYNGRVISGKEHVRLQLSRGDVIRISDEHGTMVTLTYNDGTGAAQDIVPEIRPIPLGAAVITLGRLPDNTVVLNHPQVSSHHARLELAGNGYRIVDQGSTNHVFVNAKRVTNQMLNAGDEIRIGPFKLTFTGRELTQHDESNSIRIDALHLLKTGNKSKILINDVSIAIPPRKFVAVVGGSGAGKSTLMDTLNGLRPANKGVVLYNGQDYYKNLASFSTQLGYVPQDDIIHRDLTVERALYYAAKLRLPSDYTRVQIKQRIEEVLEDVDLKSKRDLIISSLSGGQRKRVSIALELLANPNVFFLDEPTSGLDPGLDRKMMSLLRNLADKGRTIILVTHATNNINSCDYVCFLSRGGYLAYFGPPDDALSYFGKSDFAEIYSMLEPTDDNPDIPEQAAQKFKQSREYQLYVVQPLTQGPAGRLAQSNIEPTVSVKAPKRGNPWKQFWLLSLRYLELLKNDTGNLAILLLQAPIIALILFFMARGNIFESATVVQCPPASKQGITIPAQLRAPSGNDFDCQTYVNILSNSQSKAVYEQKVGHQVTNIPAEINSIILPTSGIDAQKILLIMAFAAVMFGSINGVREIVKEVNIYKRERAVNLGIIPYLFSKIVVLGVLCLLQSAILVFVVNLRAPFHASVFLPPLVEIYITMALTSLAGLMIGLLLSSLAPNNDRAMSIVPVVLIPQIIFSGAIFGLSNLPLQFLGVFFAAHWAMAGMGTTVGLHADKLGLDDGFIYQGTLFSTTSQTLAIAHLLLVWIALIVMTVVLGFLTAYFLKRKDVRR